MSFKERYSQLRAWLWANPFRTALIFCLVAFAVFQLDVRLRDPAYVARYTLTEQVGVFLVLVVPWAFLAAFLVWWGRRRAARQRRDA